MGEDNLGSKNVGRRTVLKGISTTGAVSAALTMAGTPAAESAQNFGTPEIPLEIARQVARARVKHIKQHTHFKKFDPNGLSQPELFYAIAGFDLEQEYFPVAWVFPIKSDKKEVGHIAISAQSWLQPVIRSGTGPAPQHRVSGLNVTGDVTGLSSNGNFRFIYQDPMSFGIEARTTNSGRRVFVDTTSGTVTTIDNVPKYNPSVMDTAQAEAQWQGIQQYLEQNGTLSFSPTSTGSISGVPNWNGYVCSSNWIGCSPVAGSMVIGYHENVSSWNKCDVMEDLADDMDTDSDGLTDPRDIPSGFEKYDSSYDAYNTYYGRRSEIMDQIDMDQPCVVSYWGDKTSLDSTDPQVAALPDWVPEFIGHSETAIAYEEGDNPWYDPTDPPVYVTSYDTYGGVNEITFGSSSLSFMVTSVVP